jgi:hypothetical protein
MFVYTTFDCTLAEVKFAKQLQIQNVKIKMPARPPAGREQAGKTTPKAHFVRNGAGK